MNTLQRHPAPAPVRVRTAPLALADVDTRERWLRRARDARSRYFAALFTRLGRRTLNAFAALRAASMRPAHHA